MTFHADVLRLDLEQCAARICTQLKEAVLGRLGRRGLIVAISGGIDSACTAALAARALGPSHVHGLLLPEKDSSPLGTALARKLCERLGISCSEQDISPILEALGCYRLRDDAVRSVCREFDPAWRWKIVLHGDRIASSRLNVFHVVIQRPDGVQLRARLTPGAYLQIVAATNFKQRVRKMIEYYHADRLVYAVAGTPNRLEHDQGFFVKLGDGSADVKPIVSLYKTQVYALARHLGVIEEILEREPTTDTYSLEQSQQDFYFCVHHSKLDLILWAHNHDVSAVQAGEVLGYRPEQIQRVYDDIEQKRRATAYLHAPALLLDPFDVSGGAPA